MSSNTKSAQAIVTQFLDLIFQDIIRGRELTKDLFTPGSALLLSKIVEERVQPGRIVLLTGAFKITIKIEVEEK